MYLAGTEQGGKQKYTLRVSCFDQHLSRYYHRQVFDLGSDPSIFIHQLSEKAICFEESLEEAVAEQCDTDPTPVLEDLLWDFLPLEERNRIDLFRRRKHPPITSLRCAEREEITRFIHMFDRRRLFYIRYGAVDQGRIFRLDERIYRPLLYKCRDEKEFYFRQQEKVLQTTEWKTYVYAIFNLQQDFDQSFAGFMPEALDQEKVETSLVTELCRLNSDAAFWQDDEGRQSLHYHLRPYLFGFFDNAYTAGSHTDEYLRNFRNSHRSFRWPENKTEVTEEETSSIFNETMEALRRMNRKDFTRLYRRKAKELHPDGGGSHDDFVRLLKAYEALKNQLKY